MYQGKIDYVGSINFVGRDLVKAQYEAEMVEKQRTKALKHAEYRINKNLLVGILRNRLIAMVLEEDETKRDLLYTQFLEELQRNIVPVVKDRSFKREKQTRAVAA